MIYVIADIHGSIIELDSKLRLAVSLNEKDTVVVAGDAGLMYGSYDMKELKRYMNEYGCKFIVMRGNHDARYHDVARNNSGKWTFTDDGMYAFENRYPNILYVKDIGGVYNIDGFDILFIPGAYSVDGPYRKAMGYPFEPREELDWKEADALLDEAEKKHFDYIVSHTCPVSLVPKLEDLFLDGVDQSEVSYWTEKICEEVYQDFKGNFKAWYFGHFHDDRYFPEENLTMVYNSFEVITGGE